MKPITRKQIFDKLDIAFDDLERKNLQDLSNFDYRDCLVLQFIYDTISKSYFRYSCGLQVREEKKFLASYKLSLSFKDSVICFLQRLEIPSDFWHVQADIDGVRLFLLCSDDCVVDK